MADPLQINNTSKPSSSRKTKVLALSMGNALAGVVGILAAMVLARVLTKGEYATFRQTFLAYQFVAPLLMLGLPSAVYYFLPAEKERVRGRVVDNLLLLTFLGCLFALFLAFGGNRLLAWRFHNSELERTLLYLIPYPVVMLPASIFGAVLVVQEKVKVLSVYNVLSRLLIGVGVILPVLYWKSALSSIIGQVTVTVLTSSVAIYLIFRFVPKTSWLPKWESMKEMLKYSVPLGLASMIGTISMQLDKILVSSMCTPEEFAVYANGAMEIPLIGIITGSITVVVLADMRKSVVAGDNEEALRLFRLTAEKSAYVLFPVMLFLMVSGSLFIQVLYSVRYVQSVIPFRIYLLLLPMRIVAFGAFIMALGRSGAVLFSACLGLLINATLSIYFIHKFGAKGAAIATVVATYSVLFYCIYILCNSLRMKWIYLFPWRKLVRVFLFAIYASLILININYLCRELSPIYGLSIGGGVFWTIVSVWWHGRIYNINKIIK